MMAGIASRYAPLPGGAGIADQAALHLLWSLAYREASTLAFAGAFRAVMLAFGVATILVPLLRKVAAPKVAAPGGPLNQSRSSGR